MDMNYFHDFAPSGDCPPTSTFCGGGTDKNQRLLFSANPNGNIDVFDTFFGDFLGSIPVRDPVIGPFAVARDVGGTQLLFGVTATGPPGAAAAAVRQPAAGAAALTPGGRPGHAGPSPTEVGLGCYIEGMQGGA